MEIPKDNKEHLRIMKEHIGDNSSYEFYRDYYLTKLVVKSTGTGGLTFSEVSS